MRIALWVAAGILALFLLDRLALAAERRGYIYYRKRQGSPGRLGNAFLEIHSLLEPQKKHVVEVRKAEVRKPREQGDPPSPGEAQGPGGGSVP